MTMETEIPGKNREVFEGSHENGIKGHRLLSICDRHDYGGGFFNSAQLREIAALCNQLAEEADEDE